jgi:hypothetical protein
MISDEQRELIEHNLYEATVAISRTEVIVDTALDRLEALTEALDAVCTPAQRRIIYEQAEVLFTAKDQATRTRREANATSSLSWRSASE